MHWYRENSWTTDFFKLGIHDATLNDEANKITIIWSMTIDDFELNESNFYIAIGYKNTKYDVEWNEYDPKNWNTTLDQMIEKVNWLLILKSLQN